MLNNKGENDSKKKNYIGWYFFVGSYQWPNTDCNYQNWSFKNAKQQIYVTKKRNKSTTKFPCLKWSKLVVQTDV